MKHRTSSCQARAAKPELSSYGYANGQRKVPKKLARNRHQTALRSRFFSLFSRELRRSHRFSKSQPGNKIPVKLTSISDHTGPFSTVPGAKNCYSAGDVNTAHSRFHSSPGAAMQKRNNRARDGRRRKTLG